MVYEFQCDDCGVTYEELVHRYDETGRYPGVVCPQCGSNQKTKKVSACAYQFTNPVGTDRWNSESKGHQYRWQSQQPKIRQEREDAMRKSHMGSKPYKDIDDISSGKYFGEVQ